MKIKNGKNRDNLIIKSFSNPMRTLNAILRGDFNGCIFSGQQKENEISYLFNAMTGEY